jgi:hypothetical protein
MATKEQIQAIIEENFSEPILTIDGHETAILGFATRCGEPTIAVYDYTKIVSKDGMSEEEAIEYVEFNIAGAWVGNGTPALIVPVDYLI